MPKYERFIRPMAMRFKKAHVTHPELKATFCLPIIGVKKNPSSPMFTSLGVITKASWKIESSSDLIWLYLGASLIFYNQVCRQIIMLNMIYDSFYYVDWYLVSIVFLRNVYNCVLVTQVVLHFIKTTHWNGKQLLVMLELAPFHHVKFRRLQITANKTGPANFLAKLEYLHH